jgi:predicted PurR-regulated permease PerM
VAERSLTDRPAVVETPPRTAGTATISMDLAIQITLLALLAYWSINIVGPFLTVALWSIVLTVALYPAFDWLARHTGSRKLAAALVTLPCLVVIIGPVTWLGISAAGGAGWLVKALDTGALSLPAPVESIKTWPLVGEQLYAWWEAATINTSTFLIELAPKLKPVGSKLLEVLEGAGRTLLEFLAAVVLTGFLFSPAPKLVASLNPLLRRVLSDRGEEMMDLAGATIRNVARGVVGVALLQSALGGIGLWAIGVPAAGFLTFLSLVLGVIQIGPSIVFVPIIIWCWMTRDATTAFFFTTYMLPVSLLDNILRPILMTQGLVTPMPVIVVGVIGGTLAYGLIGLFLGPIMLSVAWALLAAWAGSNDTRDQDGPDNANRGPAIVPKESA